MAYPYDDYEGFRAGDERGDRDRSRRERWQRPGERWQRPGERSSSEGEWRRAESWRESGRGGESRGAEWRGSEPRYGEWRGSEPRYREGGWDEGGARHGRDEYSGAPRGHDPRAARDTLEGGDLGWHGGVRGAEGGGGYGEGFFGTAYSLYAGRPEHVRGGPDHGRSERIGRGPKGYRRSDERIHDEVCERIARSGVDADDVEVKVEQGEVTLTGTVPRREDKWHLETICDSIFGVDEVHDHLRTSDRARRGSSGETPPTH